VSCEFVTTDEVFKENIVSVSIKNAITAIYHLTAVTILEQG
jgi:hypothetical protein